MKPSSGVAFDWCAGKFLRQGRLPDAAHAIDPENSGYFVVEKFFRPLRVRICLLLTGEPLVREADNLLEETLQPLPGFWDDESEEIGDLST